MIDLRRLQVLRVLAEHGTVTATATAMHLTPSAVSQQIKQLGQDLGIELLEREGRGVRLTSTAHVLLGHADTLLAQWQRAVADLAHEHEEVAGTVRICAVSSAVAALAGPAVTRLRAEYPRLEPLITEEESVDCYRQLLANEADVVVVLATPGAPPVTDARFQQSELLDEPQDLLVARGHRLDRPEGVALREAATEAWVVKPQHNDTYPLLTLACAAAGFTPRITHRVKEWYAVSALVAERQGVCLLPRMVPIPSDHPVARVPLRGRPSPSRRVLACIRRGSSTHPAVAATLDALQHAAAGYTDRSAG